MPQLQSPRSIISHEHLHLTSGLIAGVNQTFPARLPGRAAPADRLKEGLDRLDASLHRWLVAHSIMLLRVSLGLVFLGFGALKLFPGVSPAEDLVKETTSLLTLGLIPGPVALAGVAVLECSIGLCLLTGRAMRVAISLLAVQMVGILSPLVLLAPRLFAGPENAPTLEGQYVLKDIILVAATLVLAATLRGGRLASEPEPSSPGR